MGINTGYTGILQVIETIKLILGISKKCKNFLLSYNIIKIQKDKKQIYPKKNQKTNNIDSKIKNIKTSHDLNLINSHYLIIDLRNKSEFAKKHMKYSINIPLSNLIIHQTIKLIKYYCKDKEIFMYCNENTKSIIGSYFLTNHRIPNFILDSNL